MSNCQIIDFCDHSQNNFSKANLLIMNAYNAIKNNDFVCIKKMISEGVDFGSTLYFDGRTLLQILVGYCSYDIIEYALSNCNQDLLFTLNNALEQGDMYIIQVIMSVKSY